MDQDITTMSDGSELANRAFVGTATHTDSEGAGSTKESWSWLGQNRKSQKIAKVPSAQPTANTAVTP